MLRHQTFILTCLSLSTLANAEKISVVDYGITPGKDATYSLNRLVESLANKPGSTISFPKGRYEFYPENALESHRAVSNHDNSLKRFAFPLFELENITVDGNGSEFIFHGRTCPFAVDKSTNVTLKNFSIDWERPFHDEFKVIARDPEKSTVRLKADPEHYPFKIKFGELLSQKYNWFDQVGSNMTFDPATRSPIYDTNRYSVHFHKPHHASPVGPGEFDLKVNFTKEPPPVGSVVVSYGRHPYSRLVPAIHLANSSDITLDNITIYNAGGMGVIAERVDNITLDKVTITSPDGRMISTRADATHFIGCKGHILMENCLFEHMLDDATNVHGAYVKVVESLGENKLLCEISHFQQWGLTFAAPGDKVALLSRTTILPFFETSVTAVKALNERRFVVTLEKLPEDLPEAPLSIENLTWYPDFTMRNNIVRENRARSILVTTKGKVLIEGKTFSSQMHGILIEGDNNKWYESGAVEDITIRDNDFINIGYEKTDRYPLYISPLLNKTQHMGAGHYHRNITFTRNRIKSFNGHLVYAASVTGLKITDNTMTFSKDYPEQNEHPAIDLHYCNRVTLEHNRFDGFSRSLQATVSKDSTEISIKDNQGLQSPPSAAIKPSPAKN